jgi:microcystin-dependent protein
MSTPGVHFDYSSGNPDNLTGNSPADMGDIQGPFYDIRNWLNSGILDSIAKQGLVIGEIRHIAVSSAPALWYPCNGDALSRSVYSALFTAIGTAFGVDAANPTTTFCVPDLRGRVAAGAGTGTGLTARAIGTKWGVEATLLTSAQSGVPDHDHHMTSNNFGSAGPATQVSAGKVHISGSGAAGAINGTHLARFGNGGFNFGIGVGGLNGGAQNAAQAHDNTPPSLAIPAYIYAGETTP